MNLAQRRNPWNRGLFTSFPLLILPSIFVSLYFCCNIILWSKLCRIEGQRCPILGLASDHSSYFPCACGKGAFWLGSFESSLRRWRRRRFHSLVETTAAECEFTANFGRWEHKFYTYSTSSSILRPYHSKRMPLTHAPWLEPLHWTCPSICCFCLLG